MILADNRIEAPAVSNAPWKATFGRYPLDMQDVSRESDAMLRFAVAWHDDAQIGRAHV